MWHAGVGPASDGPKFSSAHVSPVRYKFYGNSYLTGGTPELQVQTLGLDKKYGLISII